MFNHRPSFDEYTETNAQFVECSTTGVIGQVFKDQEGYYLTQSAYSPGWFAYQRFFKNIIQTGKSIQFEHWINIVNASPYPIMKWCGMDGGNGANYGLELIIRNNRVVVDVRRAMGGQIIPCNIDLGPYVKGGKVDLTVFWNQKKVAVSANLNKVEVDVPLADQVSARIDGARCYISACVKVRSYWAKLAVV